MSQMCSLQSEIIFETRLWHWVMQGRQYRARQEHLEEVGVEVIEQNGELRRQDWKCGLPADRLEGRRLCKLCLDRRTTVGERFEEKSAVICGKYCCFVCVCLCSETGTKHIHVLCACCVEWMTFKIGGMHNNHWV